MEVQHLCYPRTLKGDRRLDGTEHAAEQSKDWPKAKTEQNEDMSSLTHYILITLKSVNDTNTS